MGKRETSMHLYAKANFTSKGVKNGKENMTRDIFYIPLH
jgi:hypothetical protein